MKVRLAILLFCGTLPSSAAQKPSTIPTATAESYFAEAQAICQADDGRLWGISLCGPMMFVDPDSRFIVASHADGRGVLKPEDGAFIGVLPTDQVMANTATEWSGVPWTQIIWPLPLDKSQRDTLIAHELFHRIQPEIGLAPIRSGDNVQLDILDGRYTIELEWRALTRALEARSDTERRQAAQDALLFRAERYRIFPKAAATERALERNEGLAEYTGVRLGNPTSAQQTDAALRDLSEHAKDSTFVRSFAYATGPAYGLLLDRCDSGWRQAMKLGAAYDLLLANSLAFHPPAQLHAAFEQRASAYDDGPLLKAEQQRDAIRQQRLAILRKQFIDGPTLTLPLKHMQVQFDPRTLQPVDNAGTVYPDMHIVDDWGTLYARTGALVTPDWSAAIVAAPASVAFDSGTRVKGDGWTLDLRPGWKIVPGTRKGDFVVQPTS